MMENWGNLELECWKNGRLEEWKDALQIRFALCPLRPAK